MKNRFWIVLFVALAFPITAAGVAAAAADDTKQVGLVIAFPDGTMHREIVNVPAGATTFEALQAASVKLASQNTQFGPAVCSVNGVGCAADNCFCDPKRFWAYFHLDPASSKWAAAAEGAGAYVPANGAVEGFVWSETDANFAPVSQPSVYTFAQIQSAKTSPLSSALRWVVPLVLILAVAAVVLYVWRRRSRRVHA
jgi:hypothetical protein